MSEGGLVALVERHRGDRDAALEALLADRDRLQEELNRVSADPARAFSLAARGFVTGPGSETA